jgi:FkbM family methyltransferase
MWPVATRLLGRDYKQKILLKDGFYMHGGMTDILERIILFEGRWKRDLWEPLTCNALEKLSRGKKEIVIAGSHIGYLVLKSALVTQGMVHSFEPTPKLYEISRENFSLNPELNKKIILSKLALGSNVGKLKFYTEDIRSSFIPYSGGHTKGGNILDVDVITLDSYAAGKVIRKIDLILLDVEGFEWRVLDGSNVVLEKKPEMILEVSPKILSHTDITPEMFVDRVRSFGYEIIYLDRDPDYANIYAKPI